MKHMRPEGVKKTDKNSDIIKESKIIRKEEGIWQLGLYRPDTIPYTEK